MSVQFEEENKYNFSYKAPQPKGITGWLINKGYVKDEAGANKLMIIVTVICFVLAILRFLM
jgi:hypothetical protein